MGEVAKLRNPDGQAIEIEEGISAGLIIAVIAFPTLGENGVERLGGVGESYFSGKLGEVFGQKPIEGGGVLRKVFRKKWEGEGEPTEEDFYAWRAGLSNPETREVETDKEVDRQILSEAVERAREKGISIVSSKLFPLIYPMGGFEDIELVVIGVDGDDRTATERLAKRMDEKGDFDSKLSKEEILNMASTMRAQRVVDERGNFREIYPEQVPNYSRETIQKICDFLYDNSEDNNEARMYVNGVEIMEELVQLKPELAETILKGLMNSGRRLIYNKSAEERSLVREIVEKRQVFVDKLLGADFDPASEELWEAYFELSNEYGSRKHYLWKRTTEKRQLKALKYLITTGLELEYCHGKWNELEAMQYHTYNQSDGHYGWVLDGLDRMELLLSAERITLMVKHAKQLIRSVIE